MRALLSRSDFRLLFVGLAASMIGDSLLMLVLAIWVNQLTGSASAAGLTLLCLAVPYVLAPVSGWLVDRLPRRRFLVVANIAAAAIMLPLLAVHGSGQVWIILAVTVAYGTSFVVIDPGNTALIKQLVPDELLGEANGALQTVKQGLRLIGPIAGAGIYATLGGPVVALINGGTFLVAAGAIALLKVRDIRDAPGKLHLLAEISAGARFLVADGILRRLTVGLLVAIFALELVESALFALVGDQMHRSTTFLAVLVCAQGLGGLCGGLLGPRLLRRTGELVALALGALVLGVAIGALATATLPVMLPAMVVNGFGLAIVLVAGNTLLLRRSPDRLMGRISAAQDGILSAAQVASLATGAGLVAVLDSRVIMLIIGFGLLLSVIYLWGGRRAAASIPADRPAAPAPGLSAEPAPTPEGIFP